MLRNLPTVRSLCWLTHFLIDSICVWASAIVAWEREDEEKWKDFEEREMEEKMRMWLEKRFLVFIYCVEILVEKKEVKWDVFFLFDDGSKMKSCNWKPGWWRGGKRIGVYVKRVIRRCFSWLGALYFVVAHCLLGETAFFLFWYGKGFKERKQEKILVLLT